MLIHLPSIVIGALIASAAIAISFLGFNSINNEPELIFSSNQKTQDPILPAVPPTAFTANGSPIL